MLGLYYKVYIEFMFSKDPRTKTIEFRYTSQRSVNRKGSNSLP